MRTIPMTVLLFFALAIQASNLLSVDTRILGGRNDTAVSALIEMLREGSDDSDVLFYRLVGVYHATGREDECLLLLDSIEQVDGVDLTGWKVSLLDISDRSLEALALVPRDDILLRIWLSRDSDEQPTAGLLPAPRNIAERAVRAMVCPDGSMNKGQIDQTLRDAALIPFLVDELCDELEPVMETAASWWDETASEMADISGSSRLHLLMARRDSHLFAGSREEWMDRLDDGGEISLLASEMVLRLNPEIWAVSWRITDVLVENGRAALAESIASSIGDPVFSDGITMSVLRETARLNELLAFCDSVGFESPDSLRARAALFRARAQRSLRMPFEVYFGSYLRFAMEFPWHPKASEAAYLAGKYYDSERNWPAAADAYMTALKSGDFGEARAYWRGGFCHYMCGRGRTGDSIWVEGTERYPFSAWCDEMLFWRARYADRTGNHSLERSLLQEVAQRHPWEFYGLLASRRTGSTVPGIVVRSLDLTADPVTALAVEMMSNGYGAMASDMLFMSGESDPGSRGGALTLMGEYGRSLGLLRSYDIQLRSRSEGKLPPDLLCFYFPAPYRELTERIAAGMGIQPSLVTGLMRQESYFNRRARSWVGASGLIQLMPGTAGDIARWYDLPVLSGDDFFVPENSIRYGSLYLSRQLSSFDGSSVLALSAYNAGPGNASKWMEAFPLDPSDPELFIEQIPLTETRGYVKHVLANSWIYEEIFN